MKSDLHGYDDTQKVWRYMKFSRFIWLLQRKQLWLSRADMLGDPWEITLAGNQLDYVISRHPISHVVQANQRQESAIERSKRIISMWRQNTFVNCWSASEHESHALWRIYCGSTEGIALETTFGKLNASVGDIPVYRVQYEIPGNRQQTPSRTDLVTKKRPMFAYEQEVRVVYSMERKNITLDTTEILGFPVDWDPKEVVSCIWVHPEADSSFMETVTSVVAYYAPTLKKCVRWSAMKDGPPY